MADACPKSRLTRQENCIVSGQWQLRPTADRVAIHLERQSSSQAARLTTSHAVLDRTGATACAAAPGAAVIPPHRHDVGLRQDQPVAAGDTAAGRGRPPGGTGRATTGASQAPAHLDAATCPGSGDRMAGEWAPGQGNGQMRCDASWTREQPRSGASYPSAMSSETPSSPSLRNDALGRKHRWTPVDRVPSDS